MPFDPDAYLAGTPQAQPFDPNQYLATPPPPAPKPAALQFDPDAYLAGTAESYANLAKRGAWSEGLQATNQGLAEAPRTAATVLGSALKLALQRPTELPIAGESYQNYRRRQSFVDRDRAALEAQIQRGIDEHPVVKAGDWLADAYRTNRELFRQSHPVRPDIEQSRTGQIVQGAGQIVPTLATGLLGPEALAASAVAQIHQESLDDAKAKGATDDQARLTAAAYLPAAGLDYAADRLALGKILAPLVGKTTIRQAIAKVAEQMLTEGSSEAAQQVWLNAAEKAGFKPDQELTEGVLDSFIVGGAVGGGVTAAGMGASAATTKLVDEPQQRELARWAQALGATQSPPAAATPSREGAGGTAAGGPLPQGHVETAKPAEAGAASAGTAAADAEIERVLAAEAAQADAQRSEVEATARRQALQQRDLQGLVGEALAPRVTALEGKTDLEKHDFWRGMQSLAGTLAQLQTTTPDGKQARTRQMELPELREQAARIFDGAAPELVDAIALKLHGSKPAESVAALRDFYRYAGTQRQQYAAAAEERTIAEQTKLQAALEAAQKQEAAARAEAKRAAQERARIRDTGRDLAGKVVDWTAMTEDELGTLAAATEQDGMDPDEIAGAQAELERRGREEGQQKPLTRAEQLRLIERYGGINPAHPVHGAEIALIRESGIGKNKKLFREDGRTLDNLAEQIRQDVQNGPQTEAEVLEWLSELAAGRAPKLYERGELDRAEYARSLPPATRFSVQRPQPHPLAPGRMIPGFNQVDFYENGENTRSASPDQLRAEDYEVPEIPEAMPTGQYSEDQVAGRARWAAAARRAEPLTTGITRKQLDAQVLPVEAPAGEWTTDNHANNRRLRQNLAPLVGHTIAGVQITSGGLKHSARLLATPEEFRMASQLGELLRTSVPVGKPEAGEETGVQLERRLAVARIDGRLMPVRFTIRRQGRSTTLYHFENAERHSGVSLRPSDDRTSSRSGNGVQQTVADLLPEVKLQEDGTYTARFATAEPTKTTATEELLTPQAAKAKEREERRMRRVAPRLFADVDVRIAEVERTMREAGYQGEIPANAEAVYLPRLRAEKDLLVVGLETVLRGLGLPRMLHESGHAYWRMLSRETREALRTAYERDLREQWSPLWRDGELATTVSQDDILSGDQLGLEEWFSELMAAVNADWAERRAVSRVPGWIADIAAELRAFVRRCFGAVADHKGLQGDDRLRFLTEDFRAFLTRGQSFQRTAAAGAQFARGEAQRPVAHVRTETDMRTGDTRQQYAFVTRNTIPGEKPWRVTYFDRNRQPYYHDDYATQAQADQVAADFGTPDHNLRFAAPQQIVAAKQVDATPTSEDITRADKLIHIMPAFQGGKYQMAHPAAALIRQHMPETERAKIESIVDYFGGGGWWGSYLALTHFPNVRRITVNEFDALRAAKIRLLHEAPERLSEMIEAGANQELLQAIVAAANADEATSGTALAKRLRDLRAQFRQADPGLTGLLVDATMSARGRAVDEQGNKTAEASLERVLSIARRDAADAAKGRDALRARGIKIEVVQGDAYARPIEQGEHVLGVFDPPYYLTTGYNGKRVPLGIYEQTAATIRELAANGNAILYTDSGWWLDAADKAQTTPDIFSGDMADRAALSRIVDSLNAVAIVPVEKRHEIIGINRPGDTHDARPARRAAGATAGARRDGSAGSEERDRQGSSADRAERRGELAGGAAPASRGVPAVGDARERFEAADAKVRDLEAKLAALAESQADDVEAQGAELHRQLADARRERNRAHAAATTARAFTVDPVDQALTKDPTVRALRDEKIKLAGEFEAAKKEGSPTEALLNRRDAIDADLEAIRRKAEQGTFPLSYDPPVAFGDANPPRNDNPPKTAQGADEPDHLRPMRILSWEPYTDQQLTERLARLKQLQAAIGGDDLEQGARLSFLANLVRDTREELEARRAALEIQAERDATGEAKPAPEAQAAREDEELAREQEQAAQATLDAEAAAAIPDVPEESYPVRENVEEVGAQVSAATLEPKSGLRRWTEKLGELLRGFRSAVPELPTFKGAERFATFREGLRLLQGLDEVVRKEAEEAVADIVEPLQAHSTTEARSQQARLQELRRQAAASPAAKAARAAEIAKLEKGLQGDPWWIFQNVVLYGDLFTRSRLYRRDDGSPISLPGGLNPAEAEHLFKLWLERAHAHPQAAAIMSARLRHKAYVQRIAEDLKVRGFVFAEGANTNYFPHVMLENWDGDIAHVKAGTAKDFRGYLVTPTGSANPIETDYLKAMYYHAVQVLAHNKRADILRDYVAREDIKQQLVDEAAQARRRDPDAPPVNWRQIFHTQYADKFALYSPDPDEIPLHPELVIDRDALAHRLGVVLGSGPLQEELKKAGLTGLQLQPAEIQEMLVAGSRELWVLPKEVAEALRGVSRRAKKTDNLVTKLLAGTQGLWKRNILFAPWNWLRFEFNNIVSDGEKVLVSDPAMATGLLDAGRDVYAFISGSKEASDDVREAFRLGVLDTLTAAEVQALRAQRPFEAFETAKDRNWRVAVNRLTSFFGSSRWNTMGWSKLREATFRFAKYKADLERMRHGATPRYGGAYWKNVEAMQRVGAPEAIHEQDRTGRLIGRQGPGTGPQASAKPYALAWEQGGRRFEESYATRDERATKRAALEAQQRQADTELVARKAAAISRATFGDYGELTPNGNSLRRLFIPFYAWTEVNFRYHANLLRNMRDMLATGRMDRKAAAGQIATQAVALGSRAAMGLVLRLALPYLAVMLWNGGMYGDDEDDLSEEDRRRFHLLLGRDDDGKIRVVYLPTAFSDVLKWFSGNRAAALVGDVAAGRTDWQTAAGAFGDGLWRDALNNTFGSAGPVFKIPYTFASGKSTFPDVTDQRTIPSYDMRRVVIGQMSDQFTAEMLELAINRDYVASRDVGEWAQQAILQVRRRDPESWAFYAIKDKAAQFEEARTGRREQRAAYDAPDAQVLRNFRRAIYQADVPTATRMYQRLLELGYTAERFESSVRAQDPLYGLPKAMRDDFVRGLNAAEREQLRSAYRYYLRMQEMEGAGRRLFPSREAGERTRARYQASPRFDLLHAEIQKALATQNDEALIDAKVERELRAAARN